MNAEVPYHLEADMHGVRFWSDTRLPFEPSGHMLEARNLLRHKIGNIVPKRGYILSGMYSSRVQRFCDVENVLFYNVGTAAFGNLANEGIRFERLHVAPLLTESGQQFRHCQEYHLEIIPAELPTSPDCSLAFAFNRLSSSTKPHEVWWPATEADTNIVSEITGAFEMRVVLHSPTPFQNLASIVKPLLDGIISALHFDPNPDAEAVSRLAEKTGWAIADILKRLNSPTAPVLGSRRLIDPYRNSLKWNPADELCEACTVLWRPSPTRRCQVDLWQRQQPNNYAT